MHLFDAHDHLQNYPGEKETAEAFEQAASAGIQLLLCNGTSPADWEKVLVLSGHRGVIPFFGLHPWFVSEAKPGWAALLEEMLLRTPSGVGEIGLDKAVNTDPALQEEAFKLQLGLAKKLARPVTIHCVRAWGKLLEILKSERPPAFLLHAYGGPPELMAELAGLGAYFSFGPGLLDPKREKLRKALRAAPPGRLLVETEAPESGSGPLQLAVIVRAAAAELGRTAEEVGEEAWRNGKNFTGELTA